MADITSPQFSESLRYHLSTPIPGQGIVITGDGLEYGFAVDPTRYDDLNYATALLDSRDASDPKPGLPPASFRADTVLLIASALGSVPGKNHLEDNEVIEADRLIFQGAKQIGLGLRLRLYQFLTK